MQKLSMFKTFKYYKKLDELLNYECGRCKNGGHKVDKKHVNCNEKKSRTPKSFVRHTVIIFEKYDCTSKTATPKIHDGWIKFKKIAGNTLW